MESAINHLNKDDLIKSKTYLDLLLKIDPEDRQIHFLYGIYHLKKDNFRSAISNLLRVIDSQHSSIYMPQAITLLSFCYIRVENFELAISIIRDALDKFPDNIQLKNMEAYILYCQKKYKQCLEIYRDVLKIDPGNVTALNGMGYCLIENLSRYEEGLEFCLRALEKCPQDAGVLDSVGWAYFKLGKYKEAEKYLKQAFEIMPENLIIKKHVTLAVEAS